MVKAVIDIPKTTINIKDMDRISIKIYRMSSVNLMIYINERKEVIPPMIVAKTINIISIK